MKKRTVGRIEVSEIGMGCMGFSHGYGKVPDEAYSIAAIQEAHAYGCTFFDTAESYGAEMFSYGHNERLLGKAVAGFRQEIVLATKFRFNDEDFSAFPSIYKAMRSHLELSMKNLRTDTIDLYYWHRVHEAVAVEDVADVMGRFEREGLIRGWGLSQVGVDLLKRANRVTPVSAVQNIYSMVERDCEKEIFPYCLEHGISVVPFSPIASGFLSGKVTADTTFEEKDDVRKWVVQLSRENLAGNQPILDILSAYAEKKHATNAQISLAWMLHKYPNVVPIPGSKNLERILENLGASRVCLTDEEFAALEAALDACEIHGHRGIEETQQASFSNNWRKATES